MLFVKITLQLRLTFELHSIPLYTLFAEMTTRSNEMNNDKPACYFLYVLVIVIFSSI